MFSNNLQILSRHFFVTIKLALFLEILEKL